MFQKNIGDINNLAIQKKEVRLPESAIQRQVTGEVAYPLCGADGIFLDLFPNAREFMLIEQKPFLTRNIQNPPLLDNKLLNSLFLKNSYLQNKVPVSLGVLAGYANFGTHMVSGYVPVLGGYDFNDLYFLISKTYNITLPSKNHTDLGLSTVLLARLRCCYGAEILAVDEKIAEEVYSIRIKHNNQEKIIHYVNCVLGKSDSHEKAGYIWMIQNCKNLEALLLKGYPVETVLGNAEDLIESAKKESDILTLVAQFAKQDSFVVVTDTLSDGKSTPPIIKAPANALRIDVDQGFGYDRTCVITNGKSLYNLQDTHLENHKRIKELCKTSEKKEDNSLFKIVIAASVIVTMLAVIAAQYSSQNKERDI